MPILLPFNSGGLLILGLLTTLPASLLIKPVTKTKSAPSATAPRFAAETDPQLSCDSPELSAAMPDKAATNLNESEIDPVFSEETLIQGDIENAFPFAHGSDGENNPCGRPGAGLGGMKPGNEQKERQH
jgi:hypothetical protein